MAERLKQQLGKFRLRKALAEHPFGTIKRTFDYTHFLLKGLEKVQTEWCLTTLAYNPKRVLNLVSFEKIDGDGRLKARRRRRARKKKRQVAPITGITGPATPAALRGKIQFIKTTPPHPPVLSLLNDKEFLHRLALVRLHLLKSSQMPSEQKGNRPNDRTDDV